MNQDQKEAIRFWRLHHLAWVISHVPIEHHPTIGYMVYNGYFFRWCPIFPKWAIYQPLSSYLSDSLCHLARPAPRFPQLFIREALSTCHERVDLAARIPWIRPAISAAGIEIKVLLRHLQDDLGDFHHIHLLWQCWGLPGCLQPLLWREKPWIQNHQSQPPANSWSMEVCLKNTSQQRLGACTTEAGDCNIKWNLQGWPQCARCEPSSCKFDG